MRALELGVELRPVRGGRWFWAVIVPGRVGLAAEGKSRFRAVAVVRLCLALAFVVWSEKRR